MKRFLLPVLILSGLAIRATAQDSTPVPQFEGFYLVEDGGFIDIREAKQTQKYALAGVFGFTEDSMMILTRTESPRPTFIAYGVSVSSEITRLVLTPHYFDKMWGYIPALWKSADAIRLRVARIAGQDDMRRLVPERDLAPGVYAIGGPSFGGAFLIQIAEATEAE